MAADIQVTFSDGTRRDCLRKLYTLGRFVLAGYTLGRFVLAGFSGSVFIGMTFIEYLTRQLALIPDGKAWDILAINSMWLPRLLRRLYSSCPQQEQALGVSLMLASADPQRKLGESPWARTYLFVYRSPKFEPVPLTNLREAMSIGCGNNVTEYVARLSEYVSSFEFAQMIEGGAMAQARTLADHLRASVEENPTAGISPHFHAGIVTPGSCIVVPHEYDEYPGTGPPRQVRHPPVASSYADFVRMARESGIAEAGAAALSSSIG
jgi:hypothetical protein